MAHQAMQASPSASSAAIKKKMKAPAAPRPAAERETSKNDVEKPIENLDEEARAEIPSPTTQPSFKLAAPATSVFAFLVPMVVDDTESRNDVMQRTCANVYSIFGPLVKSPPSVVRGTLKEGPRVVRSTLPGLVRFRMNVPSEQKAANAIQTAINSSEYALALESPQEAASYILLEKWYRADLLIAALTLAGRELVKSGAPLSIGYLVDARKILGSMPIAKDRACITASHELDHLRELVRVAVGHFGKEVFPLELVEVHGVETIKVAAFAEDLVVGDTGKKKPKQIDLPLTVVSTDDGDINLKKVVYAFTTSASCKQFVFNNFCTREDGEGSEIFERALGSNIFRECFASTRDIPDGSGVFRVVIVSKDGVEKKVKKIMDEMISHCVRYGSCLVELENVSAVHLYITKDLAQALKVNRAATHRLLRARPRRAQR